MTIVDPWVVCFRPNPRAALRLFCFPYAGSGVLTYRNWLKSLPEHVEVCALQLPGRENRIKEPLFTRLSPLIHAASKSLVSHLNQPFAFFGHSMGALIGFEFARHLREEHGIEPVHLFVSGRQAAQIPCSKPITYTLPDAELVKKVIQLKGTPEEVLNHPELIQLMLPIIRADFELNQTYVYKDKPPLTCPITAFGGLEDDEVGGEDLAAWGAQTTSSFKVYMVAGDHFFLHSAQAQLLMMISRELNLLS